MSRNYSFLGDETNVKGELIVEDGVIGTDDDEDLLQLSAGELTVNGTLSTTGLSTTTFEVTDTLTLSENTATVVHTGTTGMNISSTNGFVKVENARFAGSNLGLATDADLIQLDDDLVTVNGTVDATSTTNPTSSTTGAIRTAGGIGCAKNLYVGDRLIVQGAGDPGIDPLPGNAVATFVTDSSNYSNVNIARSSADSAGVVQFYNNYGTPAAKWFVGLEADSNDFKILDGDGSTDVLTISDSDNSVTIPNNLEVTAQGTFTSTSNSQQLTLRYSGTTQSKLGTDSNGNLVLDASGNSVRLANIDGSSDLDYSLCIGNSDLYGDACMQRVQSTTDYMALGFLNGSNGGNVEQAVRVLRTGEVSVGGTPTSGGDVFDVSGTSAFGGGVKVTSSTLPQLEVINDGGNKATLAVDTVGNLTIQPAGSIFDIGNNVSLYRAGTQLITSRQTGWSAPTGTATRSTFATSTVTLSQLAERVKALIDDLTTHGLVGN